MKMRVWALFVLVGCCSFLAFASADSPIPLDKAPIYPGDQASLQRGARIFFNYCAGCHSMNYMRYNRLAKDIGITDQHGDVIVQILKENFIFSGDNPGSTLRIAMPQADAKKWFGVAPPDLTLIARIRGVDWLYTYLRSFYKDDHQPWGTNNRVYPGVAMPNVLLSLQGEQAPIYRIEERVQEGVIQKSEVIDRLVLLENGAMSPHQFDVSMADLVNFLAYTAEPFKKERERIGVGVLLFLVVLTGLLYLLKEDYWKDV